MDSNPAGSRLRAVREAQGRTLRGVAAKVGINPSHLSRIERGDRRPSVELLRDLTRELGLKDIAAAIDRVWDGPS